MLNETAFAHLSSLTYRADAARRTHWYPISGIYWDDEIPDFPQLMKVPEDGLIQILRLLSIRCRIWQGEPLTGDDQGFWDDAKSQLPECPIFRRVKISTEDQLAQSAAVQAGAEIEEALFADADKVSVTEKCPGVHEVSATFDLRKHVDPTNPPTVETESWLARIFSRHTT